MKPTVILPSTKWNYFMIPYDYEMELKLRVIKCILGIGDDTTRELWRETMLLLSDSKAIWPMKSCAFNVSDDPTLNKEKKDED